MPSLKSPYLEAHTWGTFEKHVHFGGSCPPLVFCAASVDQLLETHSFSYSFVLGEQVCSKAFQALSFLENGELFC
jgi:hypothetical protein